MAGGGGDRRKRQKDGMDRMQKARDWGGQGSEYRARIGLRRVDRTERDGTKLNDY